MDWQARMIRRKAKQIHSLQRMDTKLLHCFEPPFDESFLWPSSITRTKNPYVERDSSKDISTENGVFHLLNSLLILSHRWRQIYALK